MRGYRLQLLLLSAAAIVLIVASAFFTDWFVIRFAGHAVHVDLRAARMCDPECVAVPLGDLQSMYPGLALIAFWTALPLFVLLATQAGAKLLSGTAYVGLSRFGTGLGMVVFFTAFGAGYLAAPEGTKLAGFELVTVDRMWGPIFLVLGSLAAVLALRYAVYDGSADDAGEYQPVVIVKPDTRLPVTPISGVNRVPMPAARTKSASQAPVPARAKTASQAPLPPRTKSASQAPLESRTKSASQAPLPARTKSASQAPLPARTKAASQAPLVARTATASQPPPIDISRTHTSSSGPVDVAARLGGAGLEVAIRQPAPEPVHVPEDQIPVAPESGLVIRKRTPSTAPEGTTLPLPPDVGVVVRTRAPSIAPPPMMASVASALGITAAAADTPPATAINYAVTTAAISSAGITATREDGLAKLVAWPDIVGIVARRLPPHAPFDGVTFVDIVSTAGSTLRILPSTEVTGHALDGDHTERARAIVQLLAAMALDAKLDAATKVFANGSGKAGQLRDDRQLAAHDDKLA